MDKGFYGNVMLALLKGDIAVTRPLHTSGFGEVQSLHPTSIWHLPEVLEEVTSEMSSGGLRIWVTRGIKGFPWARSGRADWN